MEFQENPNITSRYFESNNSHFIIDTKTPFKSHNNSRVHYEVRINEDNINQLNHNRAETDFVCNSSLLPNELVDEIIRDCTVNRNELVNEPCNGDLVYQRLVSNSHANTLSSNIIEAPCMQSCSKSVPKSVNFDPTARFANDCNVNLKQQYLSRDHIMPNQTVEVKQYAEKTTYCRPTLNLYGQHYLHKTMQRNARLRKLVQKLVLARKMEKQEHWNNYINMLRNKHRFSSPKPINIENHNEADNYDRSEFIDDYCNTNFMSRESNLSVNLLQDFDGVRGNTKSISYNNYPNYFNNATNPHYTKQFYENDPYCYPISSQGRLVMLQKERANQRQGFAYDLRPKPPDRFFRNDTIVVDTDSTRRRSQQRKSSTTPKLIIDMDKKTTSITKPELKSLKTPVKNLQTKPDIQPEITSVTEKVRKLTGASLTETLDGLLPQTVPFRKQSEAFDKIPEAIPRIEPETAPITQAVRKSTRASLTVSPPTHVSNSERQSKTFETLPETKSVVTSEIAPESITKTSSIIVPVIEPEIKSQFEPEVKPHTVSDLACKCSPLDAMLYCAREPGSDKEATGTSEGLRTRTKSCCRPGNGSQTCPALQQNDEYTKISANISRLKDKLGQSNEKQKQGILTSIEEKIDNLIKSINQFVNEMKSKGVVSMMSKSTSICECIDSNNNFGESSSCTSQSVTNKQVFYSMVQPTTRSEFGFSNVDTQIQNKNRSKIDKILQEELDKSNKIKKDIESMLQLRNDRPCSVHITFDIPTKDISTEVTNSLCKAKPVTNTTEEDTSHCVPSASEKHMTLAVNTDPLGLSALLRVSTETVKQILSYMPNIDCYSYLSLLQFPQLSRRCVSHYICNICGAAFNQPSQLSDHIQEHNLGNTRDCSICRHTMDVRHRRTGLYSCQYCGQRFTRAYCCELHQQSCARRFGRRHDVASSLMLLK